MFNPFFHPLRQALLNYSPMAGDSIPVDSIQQVNFALLDTATVDIVEIEEVDLDRSIILITGHCWQGSFTRRIFTHISFDDSTHVRAERNQGVTDHHSWVDVFVIQLASSTIKSMQYFSHLFEIDEKQYFLTIDEVDLNKSIVVCQGCYTSGTGDIAEGSFSFPFINSTHIFWYRKTWLIPVTSYLLVVEFK